MNDGMAQILGVLLRAVLRKSKKSKRSKDEEDKKTPTGSDPPEGKSDATQA